MYRGTNMPDKNKQNPTEQKRLPSLMANDRFEQRWLQKARKTREEIEALRKEVGELLGKGKEREG
jgi:hypothetical protein